MKNYQLSKMKEKLMSKSKKRKSQLAMDFKASIVRGKVIMEVGFVVKFFLNDVLLVVLNTWNSLEIPY